MTKPDWGIKRTCQACGTRFYDLKRSPAVCPSCGKEFDPSATVKKKRGRPPASEKKKHEETAKTEEVVEAVEATEAIELFVEEDDLIEEDDEGLEEKEVVSSAAVEKDD